MQYEICKCCGKPKRPKQQSKRFPANLLLSHSVWCVSRGVKRVRGDGHKGTPYTPQPNPDTYGFTSPHPGIRHQDADGMEEVEDWECVEDCPVRLLDEQSGIRKSGGGIKSKAGHSIGFLRGEEAYHFRHDGKPYEISEGGASRYFTQFYYAAKASRSERNAGCEDLPEGQGFDKNTSRQIAHINHQTGETTYSEYQPSAMKNTHPTVKNLSLCRWLIRLTTPPGGTVLDCFLGSGSTAVAAIHEGMHFIGIEQDESYCTIARSRIAHAYREI